VSFFSSGVSYVLNSKSYVQGYWAKRPISPELLISTLAHELCHGFSNNESIDLYKDAYNRDAFLNHTHWHLINCYGSGDEEEFVIAIEGYLAVKNGLMPFKQAKKFIGRYRFNMPIALILFDLLNKESDIPANINDWLINCFKSGYVKVGSIETQTNSLSKGWSKRFYKIWNTKTSAEKREQYKTLIT